jgi:1-acyl-sn-glycerol-3-phosphate acyltransferase
MTFPVAAKEYWDQGALRHYVITKVFRAVLIQRRKIMLKQNPLEILLSILKKGQSLILFPEGTRSRTGDMGHFKSGIYHIAKQMPQIEFVPVYLKNAHRVLPKGHMLPVPMLCSATFGASFTFQSGLTKNVFLTRARNAVERLKNVEVRS